MKRGELSVRERVLFVFLLSLSLSLLASLGISQTLSSTLCKLARDLGVCLSRNILCITIDRPPPLLKHRQPTSLSATLDLLEQQRQSGLDWSYLGLNGMAAEQSVYLKKSNCVEVRETRIV